MAITPVTIGYINLALQTGILILLLMGVRFARKIKMKLIRHGQLTTIALALHTLLILMVMIPTFSSILPIIGFLPWWAIIVVLTHAVTGTIAEMLGAVLVVSWRFMPLAKSGCLKRKRWMKPTFYIWAFSLIFGAVIRIVII